MVLSLGGNHATSIMLLSSKIVFVMDIGWIDVNLSFEATNIFEGF